MPIEDDIRDELAEEDDKECSRCGSVGGDECICDECSATFCSKCDTNGVCPECGADLP